MQLEEVFNKAEVVTTAQAAELMGRHPNSVRGMLNRGRLVGRHVGREWVIPVFFDEDGNPVFLSRYPKGDGGDDG
jgi:hypothetical protein